MSVLKRRSRMISFRVSEDEYAGLKNLCVHHGARSVSDMARDAVHRLINNPSLNHLAPNHLANHHLESVVQVLQVRVEALDLEVRRLVAMNGLRVMETAVARNGDGE